MRTNYPLISQELSDILLEIYARYTYLLGRDNDQGFTTYSGFYDIAEESIQQYISDYIVLRNDFDPITPEVPIIRNVDLMSYRRSIIRG